MDIFSVFLLLGGLAYFLFGMSLMSSGLEKMAGGSLERILKKMTANPFAGMLLGAAVTAAIQSSSAITVMLIGLVNSGIMQLGQTVGVIMGSNIGTTMTAWLLSLIGVGEENPIIKLINPKYFAPLLAFAGILLIMLCKRGKRHDVGTVLMGFAVLMFGMSSMSGAVSPLAEDPNFQSILTAFGESPLLGILVGALVTAVIQSSSASVGILQSIALNGGLTFGSAIPIIMGQNIGTCVTSILSCAGVGRNAKKVAVIHVSFNLIGTALVMALYCFAGLAVDMSFLSRDITPVGIALVHTAFNLFTTAMLLPFSRKLEQLADSIIPDKPEKVSDEIMLSDLLLATPSVAVSECKNRANMMAGIARDSLLRSVSLIDKPDRRAAATVVRDEDRLDRFEDKLGTFLVKLSSRELSDRDGRRVSNLLHSIGDFERIGDHAQSLTEASIEIKEKALEFSPAAKSELDTLFSAVSEIVTITADAFCRDDSELAKRVEPLEQVIDGLTETIRFRHIDRLQQGKCTIVLGFVLSDILTDASRVSDHCSNIAVSIIETEKSEFDTHQYLGTVKTVKPPEFLSAFNEYSEKYSLE